MRDLRADPFAERHTGVCSVAAAVIGAVGTAVGGIVQAKSAKTAANAQVQAQNAAISEQNQMFNTVQGNLEPYNTAGQSDLAAYNSTPAFSYGSFNYAPFSFSPTQSQLEQTPGYQFTLAQGLKAVQNSAAARGLGTSGAAQKGAANFATGLADTTFNQQLANQEGIYQTNYNTALGGYQANYGTALGQYQTNVNKLLSGAQLGENAAANVGNYGTQTGANIASNLTGIGQAQAGGAIGAGNAISGAATGIGQSALLPQLAPYLQNNLLSSGLSSGGMYAGGGSLANASGLIPGN